MSVRQAPAILDRLNRAGMERLAKGVDAAWHEHLRFQAVLCKTAAEIAEFCHAPSFCRKKVSDLLQSPRVLGLTVMSQQMPRQMPDSTKQVPSRW